MSAQPHRSSSTVLGVIVAGLLLVALPAAAGAQSESHGVAAAPVNALGTDVSAVDQRDNRAAVAVRGTDVSAVDQRDNRAAVAVRGTDVSAPDQQASRTVIGEGGARFTGHDRVDRTSASQVDRGDDSAPSITLLALIALGIAGIGFTSWHVATRKRSGAAV